MIAIKNILVATDFGPSSATALRYGRVLTVRDSQHEFVLPDPVAASAVNVNM